MDDEIGYGNCWTYAIRRAYQQYNSGAGFIVRRSKYSWVPHIALVKCCKNAEVEEFVPVSPVDLGAVPRWLRWLRYVPLHTIIFRGYVRRGPAYQDCQRCENSECERKKSG